MDQLEEFVERKDEKSKKIYEEIKEEEEREGPEWEKSSILN